MENETSVYEFDKSVEVNIEIEWHMERPEGDRSISKVYIQDDKTAICLRFADSDRFRSSLELACARAQSALYESTMACAQSVLDTVEPLERALLKYADRCEVCANSCKGKAECPGWEFDAERFTPDKSEGDGK